MSTTDSTLKRSIGLSGVIRFLIAVITVIAFGAAVAAGRYVLAIVFMVFLLAAIGLWYAAEVARRDAGSREIGKG